jgi:hypothetical protein
MTVAIDEIRALPVDVTGQQDTQAIADALSAGRVRLVERFVGIGTILAVMAPNGGAFLDALEAMAPTNSNVKWALKLIESGGMDVGMEATRAQLAAFAQAAPEMEAGINALLNLAEVPDQVSEFEVRCMCWSDSGEWMV